MHGDAGAEMEKEDAGRGFVGEVPSNGFYGDYKGYTVAKGAGYSFDASDCEVYQGV